MQRSHVPAKRLGGFYFAYYAAIGVLVPYLGLYLQARGLSAAEMGLAFGLLALTRIVSPYFWGAVADARGRMPVVLGTLGGALACFLALPWMPSTGWMLTMIVLYGLLVNGTMAQFEVVTFAHLGAAHQGYTRIRLWGSVGFLVLVLALGPVLDLTGVLSLPYWIAGLFVGAWLVARRIPEPPLPPKNGMGDGSALRRALYPSVLALLVTSLLAQLSFGPYYGFYSVYLQDHGYSKTLIGALWALGVVAEVALFWWVPRHLPRLSLAKLLVLSQVASAVRWVATPYLVGSAWATAAVQLLHALSFGVYHLAAVNLIQRYFPASQQGRGQAIYIGMSYGVGGAIGGWGAGQLWAEINPDAVWLIAAAAAALAAVIAHLKVQDELPASNP